MTKKLLIALLGVILSSPAYADGVVQRFGTNGNLLLGVGTTTPAATLDLSSGSDAVIVPLGTTGQRPTGSSGMVRYNSTLALLEAYINGAWNALIYGGPISTKTGSYTVLSSDINGLLTMNSASAATFTLPQAGTTGFEAGKTLNFINAGAGIASLSTTTSTFVGMATTASNIALSQYGYASCESDGTNWQCAGYPATASGGGGSGNLGASKTTNNPQVSGDATTGFFSALASTVSAAANGIEAMRWTTIASGVDYFKVIPGLSGTAPQLTVDGSTANQNLNVTAKGSGLLQMNSTGGGVVIGSTTQSSITNNTLTIKGTQGTPLVLEDSGQYGAGFVINPTNSGIPFQIYATTVSDGAGSGFFCVQEDASGNPNSLCINIAGLVVGLSTGTYGWGSSSNANNANDTAISRASAGLIAFGTGAAGNTSGSATMLNLTLGGTVTFPSARKGTFVCTAGGTITVSNSNILAASDVLVTLNAAGGTITTPPAMKTKTAGTGFSELCGASDTSTYNYTVLN